AVLLGEGPGRGAAREVDDAEGRALADGRAQDRLEALRLDADLRAEARVVDRAGRAHRAAAGDRLGDDPGGDGAPRLGELVVAEAARDPEGRAAPGAELEVALARARH